MTVTSMQFLFQTWHILLAVLCGWVNERQQRIIEFQHENSRFGWMSREEPGTQKSLDKYTSPQTRSGFQLLHTTLELYCGHVAEE